MSALRLSRPGLPTRLVILDEGVTPVGKPSYTGAMIAAAWPALRKPLTDEQRLRTNAAQKRYRDGRRDRTNEAQRLYRAGRKA